MRYRLSLHIEGQTQMYQDLECFMKQGTTKEDQPVIEAEVPSILALKQTLRQENHCTEVSQNHFNGLRERKEEPNIMITLITQVKQRIPAQQFVIECQ